MSAANDAWIAAAEPRDQRIAELEAALRDLLDHPFPTGMYDEWRAEGSPRSADAMDAYTDRIRRSRALIGPEVDA